MFHPKGPSVLNCHACILCGTKGAYVKNEQWIRVSTRETETERESKWFCKHRWLSLASLLVLHKCFEDILFFPRSPNFSSAATVLLFRTMFVCLRLMPQLNTINKMQVLNLQGRCHKVPLNDCICQTHFKWLNNTRFALSHWCYVSTIRLESRTH